MSDFIGPLEENFETANARITPGLTIGGMGEVSLPYLKPLGGPNCKKNKKKICLVYPCIL